MAAARSAEFQYRYAFENFSRAAKRVQNLTQNPSSDRSAFETALLDLEKAHLTYKSARDALVYSLLPLDGATHPPSAGAAHDPRSDIQAIAELLWESAGRPDGSAEQDWRRAEAIVQSAIEATEVSSEQPSTE